MSLSKKGEVMRFFMMMSLVLCLTSVTCFGSDFKNPKAKKAEEKYEKAKEKILKTYIDDLRDALKEALRREDLEEANKIKSEVDRLIQDQTIKDLVGTLVQENKEDCIIVIHKDLTYDFQNIKTNKIWHSGTIRRTVDGFEFVVSDGRVIPFIKKDGYYYRPDNK